MKRILLLLLLTTFLTKPCWSQTEEDKKITFFNITKVSYSSLHKARADRFVEGEGNFITDVNDSGSIWGLNTVTGVFLFKKLSLGVGLGLDGYSDPNLNTMPAYFDLRYYLKEQKRGLNTYINIGPAINPFGENSRLRKGTILNLGAGYVIEAGESTNLIVDIFYNHKTLSLTPEKLKDTDTTIVLDAFGFGIGIVF
ncbi:hypothetical protein [Aurantibacter aestuarii]|uniref:Outer membrane protein beta-barrel domain-containing protein n=1 Tax=Aurantibacter aestuarii TaxID=1266046 RepID=A0A2T1NCF1_9FLAO|nr:hypothetical protein [Aurantibacter aestuarii]PSG90104.1 hypothetical protein C7H52_02175 [Aurantibacter aestuarii]